MMKFFILLWIFSLGGILVFGQERVIDDIKFNNEPILYKIGPNHFRLSYPVKRQAYPEFQIKIQDFDTLLNLRDTSSIQVRGRFELMASGRNQSATFNLLGDEEAKNLLLFRTDHNPHLTRAIPLKPISSIAWNSKTSPLVVTNKESEHAVISFWNKETNRSELIFLENGNRQTWAKTTTWEEGFIPRETLLTQNYLIILLSKDLGTRQREKKISVWNLTSGSEQYVIKPDDGMRKKTFDNILYFDRTHVLLTGQISFDKKISKAQAGIPYLDRLNVSTGEVTSFPFRADRPDQKFLWTSIHNFNGVHYLFGEDFSFTTLKGQLNSGPGVDPDPLAVLLSPLASIPVTMSTSIFLQDIVVLDLSNEDSRIATIPAQAKSITIPGKVPAPSFARDVYENALTHFMGLTDDNHGFYFENGGEIIRLDMTDGSTRSLGFFRIKSQWKILNVNETKIMTVAKNSDHDLVLRCLDYESEEEIRANKSKDK